MLTLLGYLSAILMGAVLGLVGGGGSILTVPILVYLFHFSPIEATAYSLFIVGLSSLIAAQDYYKRGLIDLKTGLTFAVPAFLSVYSVRRFLMPNLPEEIDIHIVHFSKDSLIMSVFALIMLLAAYSMLKPKGKSSTEEKISLNYLVVFLEGIVVGGITGFVGAGGGFLIIPALVVLAGLEMKVAVGTSLLIIAIKSLIGFIGDMQTLSEIHWPFLAFFISASLLGLFIGIKLSRNIPSEKLKPGFAWFVLAMGIFIIAQQLLA